MGEDEEREESGESEEEVGLGNNKRRLKKK